jgi:ParB-like chromosome segregation protein Spo0J
LYSLALREGSLTQEALAERIGKTAAHVSQHLSLLRLGEVEQRAIADGRIGFSAALDLLSLPQASREQVVATVSASEKPMTGAEVKELTAQVRNSAPEGTEDAPPSGGAGRRKLAMGLGKFREIMGALGEKDRVFGPLWNAMDGVLYGEISPDDFTEEWMEFLAKLHFDYLEKLKADGKISRA